MSWAKNIGLVAGLLLSPSLSWGLYFHLKNGSVIQGEIKDGNETTFKVVIQGRETLLQVREIEGLSLDGQLHLWNKPIARLALYNLLERDRTWYLTETPLGVSKAIGDAMSLLGFIHFVFIEAFGRTLWNLGEIGGASFGKMQRTEPLFIVIHGLGVGVALTSEMKAEKRAERFNVGLRWILRLPDLGKVKNEVRTR